MIHIVVIQNCLQRNSAVKGAKSSRKVRLSRMDGYLVGIWQVLNDMIYLLEISGRFLQDDHSARFWKISIYLYESDRFLQDNHPVSIRGFFVATNQRRGRLRTWTPSIGTLSPLTLVWEQSARRQSGILSVKMWYKIPACFILNFGQSFNFKSWPRSSGSRAKNQVKFSSLTYLK